MVVESLGFDSYTVRRDGSGRVSKRNRRYRRRIKAYKDVVCRRAEPKVDSQQPEKVASQQVVEVARSVPDTAGYSTLLPESTVESDESCEVANKSSGVANMPNVVQTESGGDHTGGNAVDRLRRSSRSVWRPSNYGQ